MLLKAAEQCFNTLERAEMLLLLLRRFPESVVQHGVRQKALFIPDLDWLALELCQPSPCTVCPIPSCAVVQISWIDMALKQKNKGFVTGRTVGLFRFKTNSVGQTIV